MRFAAGLALLLTTAGAAIAGDGTGPVIVIPGRAGVPVMINGVDASWAVAEGDWGLANRIHMQPTIMGAWDSYQGKRVGHYYPSAGHLPGYGRLEGDMSGPAKKAQSYHESWAIQSAPAQFSPPVEAPPVAIMPEYGPMPPRAPGVPPIPPVPRPLPMPVPR